MFVCSNFYFWETAIKLVKFISSWLNVHNMLAINDSCASANTYRVRCLINSKNLIFSYFNAIHVRNNSHQHHLELHPCKIWKKEKWIGEINYNLNDCMHLEYLNTVMRFIKQQNCGPMFILVFHMKVVENCDVALTIAFECGSCQIQISFQNNAN